MTRRLAVSLALLIAVSGFATTRINDAVTRPASGATVGGTVTAVDGNLIHLAGGNITIDVAGAKIHGASDRIEPGMLVFATLTATDVAPNAPLPASSISVTRLPDATLSGPVQRVDVAANTLAVLGRTIHVNADTSFGGVRKSRDAERPTLADILPNQLVQVTVDETNGQLVATSILVLTPVIPEVHSRRGEVKSIDAQSWVIDELTVQIDAQTKIAGDPKVGDTVEVLYRVDSSRAYVAISIIKLNIPVPPFLRTVRLTATVSAIGPQEWAIVIEEGRERATVKINESSKIEPGIVAGDRVEILAAKGGDGTLTALVILKRRF
ncbi:MAG TPA: DUF5666 domain-containing protein [Thermoanaerobaculia bacterium]|nr:DUF5666 domain-containing protein [Thermoanaerobaculia bacterium]